MKKVLLKFPSRQRPDQFFKIVDLVYEHMEYDSWEIVATFDLNDKSVTNPLFKDKLSHYDRVRPYWGTSTGKIDAVNRDLCFAGDFDILCLLSDDMWPQKGFGPEILKAFEDGFSGLVHFPDGIINERLCTFSVMDRAYFDLFGYIYNPIYKSVYCDQEQHAIAVMTDRYKYVPVNIVKHLHPAFGLAPNDDLYRKNEEPGLYAEDGNTYRQRAANNFDIINPKKCNPFLVS